MRIQKLFRRDIHRTIEEVVKVDLDDDAVLASELDEYVATSHIVAEFHAVVEAYQESINNPNETCTVWVSGFFGAGKSSWAKTLGCLLGNMPVGGRPAAERFFARTDAPALRALLNTVHATAPTLTVMLNLATGSNVVAREGESVVLPVYRALLRRLGYSSNLLLAELEYTLEGDGLLADFEACFERATGKRWADRRYTGLAKSEASRALHELDPATYSQPDSWARAAADPDIDADWFAQRALKLLERRGGGARRLAFIVDEAGQYVARSEQRMLDLQGLAESFQKRRGPLWLVVTSQERLNDVVDSLESRRVELARAQARFPLRVDLLPTDIDEVTGKRVLDKTDAGQAAVRELIAHHQHQFAAHTRLASPTRATEPSLDDAVRLYPLVPYQVQLLIDAVSARRAHGGASPTVGGSNRTLIKHAQQLITNPQVGLGGAEVGALVTLDRSYDLLHELIPTSWRAEVDHVADKYGAASTEAQLMKVIALTADVPALLLTAANLAVLLHPHVAADSRRPEVEQALARLVHDDRLRSGEDGYKLQSPEQKDWEQARRGIDLSQGAATRLRRALLRDRLAGLRVSSGRTFPVEVTIEGETVITGDLALQIEEADLERRTTLRTASREQQNTITWVYSLSPSTWEALVELERSRTMIARRDVPNKTPAEVELLGEERAREQRHEATALTRLAQDLQRGQIMFRGQVEDLSDTGDLRTLATRVLSERLPDIYPQLPQFTATLRRDTPLLVLRTADLAALRSDLDEDGIGLLRTTPTGVEVVTGTGPLALLTAEVRSRASYGQEATGGHLERHFAGAPCGASLEVVQVLCAAGIRAGVLEVVHQGQVIRSAADQRLDRVFGTVPAFRSTAFRPPSQGDAPLETRVELARRLHQLDIEVTDHSSDALAAAVLSAFGPARDGVLQVRSLLNGLGIPPPDTVTRLEGILRRLDADPVDVVLTAQATWADLVAGRDSVSRLEQLLTTRLEAFRTARQEADRSPEGLPEELRSDHDELVDLMRAGDVEHHAGRLLALAGDLHTARVAAGRRAAADLHTTVRELADAVRDRFADLEPATVTEALRELQALDPGADGDGDAAVLAGRVAVAHSRADAATRSLEQIRAAGSLAWVRVGDLAGEVIRDEAELAAMLDRLREAVAALLDEGKQVRLH